MKNSRSNIKRTARIAGLLYIIVIILAIYGSDYVPSKIMVTQNAVSTTSNLLSSELLFRTGILVHLSSVILIAIMALLLYKIFSPIDNTISKMMVTSVFVQVPIFLVLEVFHFAALIILKEETLKSFSISQKQELAFFFMRLRSSGISAAQVFWGLWLLAFGFLVYRSKLIPLIFGILLIINGFGYVVDGSAFIILQRSDFLKIRELVKFTFIIGIAPTMLWLLIKGVRSHVVPTNG